MRIRLSGVVSMGGLIGGLVGGLTGCEQAASPSGGEPGLHFTDVTRESGIEMTPTSGEDPPKRIYEVKGCGLALIDFDRDGDQDLFVPNGATLASPAAGPGARLFENLGGLRFQDITERAGISFNRWGYGVALADYDADGLDDLFVTCLGKNALLRNLGQGRMTEVTDRAGIQGNTWSTASTFGDIDGDGDLDLYVVNYAEMDMRGTPPQTTFMGAKVLKGPDGLDAEPDVLYENLGDGTFKDISESSGIRQLPASYGLDVIILDFNGDHIPDIYVGNDSRPSFLFRGLGGNRFEEIGEVSGIGLNEDGAGQATMGIAVGDVDGNGLPDIFTTNFMFDTNTLHLNLGDMTFEDHTRDYGLYLDGRPHLSWATCFFDFDHDADEDLVFFNGHVYRESLCDIRNWGYRQVPVLYQREGDRFSRVLAETAGAWLDEPHCDRSTAFGDLDGDGDVDFVVSERNGPVRVIRNDRDGGNWLIVQLNDGRPGRDRHGIGSRVALRAGGPGQDAQPIQYRWIVGGVSFLAANQLMAHFGLPEDVDAVTLEVTWADGQQQVVENVPTRTHYQLERE